MTVRPHFWLQPLQRCALGFNQKSLLLVVASSLITALKSPVLKSPHLSHHT